MERNRGLWKGALIYGGINVAFFAIGLTALYLSGRNPVFMGRYLEFIMAPAFSFIMLRVFKEQWNRGLLHFWEGMTMAFFYALVVGIGSGLIAFVFMQWIDPEILIEYRALLLEQIELQKQNMGEDFGEEAYTLAKEAAKETTAGIIFQDLLVKMGGMALLSTSFITIFMRKTESR